MNREPQAKLMGELDTPGLPWQISQDHESRAVIKWLPIANLTQARIHLGLSSNASWVRGTQQSATIFQPGKPCVFLLPVLEVGLDELRRLLEQGLQASGLSIEFLQVFPFEDVAATGLESRSERWTGLALKWAEQLPISIRLQRALEVLKTNGPTQRIRQAAQKLLARKGRSDRKGGI
jgi:hypothetical protein